MIIHQIYARLGANLPSFYRFSKMAGQHHVKDLPAYFDINVSLQSNIQKRKNIEQVVTLHGLMRSYYTPSHMAKSMRVIAQIIDREKASKGRVHNKQPYTFKSHHEELRKLFGDLWQIKNHKLTADDKIDFLHFIYKTAHYRISLKTLDPRYGIELAIFRKQLIKNIIDPVDIQEFNLQQLAVIINYLNVIREPFQHLQSVLIQIKNLLTENTNCIAMHLLLLGKTLKDIQNRNDIPQSLDRAMVDSLRKLTASNIFLQISRILDYIDIVTIVQVYNLLSEYNEYTQPLLVKALQLLPQLRNADYSIGFQTRELPIFFADLLKKQKLPNESRELLKQLSKQLSVRGKHSGSSKEVKKNQLPNDEIP